MRIPGTDFAARLTAVLALIAGCGRTVEPVDTDPSLTLDPSDRALLDECLNPATWRPSFQGQHLLRASDCIIVPRDAACPDASKPLPWDDTPTAYCSTMGTLCITGFTGREDTVRDTGFGDTDADSESFDICCYTYIGPSTDIDCGRRWIVDGASTTAPCEDGDGWSRSMSMSIPANPEDRRAAAHRWAADAAAEHASIAAFARLTLDLLAHGAPAALISDVQRAMQDEIRHATNAYAIASALAGRAMSPGMLPIHHAPTPTLVALAVDTAIEGGLGEMLAAATAAARLSVATDPQVRAALQGIVDGEARHAALAWRIVDWAVTKGGPAVRDAVEAALVSRAPPR